MLTDIYIAKWNELDAQKFIDEVRRSADVVSLFRRIVVDLAQFNPSLSRNAIPFEVASDFDLKSLIELSGLETKEYTVTTPEEWKECSDSCYTVRFKCCKRWQDLDAKHYTLNEWIGSEDYMRDPKVRSLETIDGKLSEDIIVTAYDSEKTARVIISGLHRAAALTVRTRECDPSIPPVRIYECRGKNIDRLFPCDFLHI